MKDFAVPRRHNTLRGGIVLGVLVGAVVWLWLYVVDVITKQPLHTFIVLGGVARYTVVHFIVALVFGIVAIAVVHGAAREPRLLVLAGMSFVVIETALVMLTLLWQHAGMGALAWPRVMGGSVLGAVVAVIFLARGHPLRETARRGERIEE